ncbi:MAG: lipid A deacylase LpxR family protein [Verrucomicrobiota bacterium]|nr:lipid A deacylase LpxR family protein [Verrucomicrobiota bacterium]
MKSLAKTVCILGSALLLSAEERDRSTLSITIENDSFLGTDRYYTHGMRMQYMHRPNELPSWAVKGLSHLPNVGMEISSMRIGGALGQELYTPANLRARALIVNDRPYGAWMHGSLILRRSGQLRESVGVMDELELDVGVVGPEALGEETQQWWHDTVDYIDPKGWDNQLESEPAVQLFLNRSLQFRFETSDFWGLDIVPHGKVALGNIYVYGEVGSLFRFGYNLPREYTISPMESFSTHPSANDADWSFYGFLGADGRVVGRNLFLDGNTFESSHSVDRELLVADFRVGGAVRYKGVEGVVSLVKRTREFKAQVNDEAFLSVTMQFHF